MRQLSAAVAPFRGRKWATAILTRRGAGGGTVSRATSLHSTRPPGGAQRRCSATSACTALLGTRYTPPTSIRPWASPAPSPGSSGSASGTVPRWYVTSAASSRGTLLPRASSQVMVARTLRRGQSTPSTLRTARNRYHAPPVTAKTLVLAPCSPSRPSASMARLARPSLPPFGSEANRGAISARDATAVQPSGPSAIVSAARPSRETKRAASTSRAAPQSCRTLVMGQPPPSRHPMNCRPQGFAASGAGRPSRRSACKTPDGVGLRAGCAGRTRPSPRPSPAVFAARPSGTP